MPNFNHPTFDLPEGIHPDLIRDRVRHALQSERAVGEANDQAALYNEEIQAADAWIDQMREYGIDPLTGSEHESVFNYLDTGEGEDLTDTWCDEEGGEEDEDSDEGW